MRRWWTGAALGLALAVSAVADDTPKPADAPPKKGEAKSPAARLKAIKKEVADAQAEYYKAAGSADRKKKEDVEKVQKLYQEFNKKQQKGQAEALKIAETSPKSAAGLEALQWLLTTPQTYYTTDGKTAMELMAKHYAASPKVAPVVRMLGRYPLPEGLPAVAARTALLKAVVEKNPDRTARGYAAMGLASQAVNKYTQADRQKKPDADKLAVAAEKQLEALTKNYGNVPGVGQWAKGELFELQHLRIGKAAPDISGEDLDGTKFKLSDYRGKVVVLDFWGDW